MTANEVLQKTYEPGAVKRWLGELLFWVLWASPTFQKMMMDIPRVMDDNAEMRKGLMDQHNWVIRKLKAAE